MNISFIGNGNLAQNLAVNFYKLDFNIVEIYARDFPKIDSFSKKVKANPLKRVEDLNKDIDLLIISVSDDALDSVLTEIPKSNFIIVHTSGSIPIDVFYNKGFENFGVFYPLYSFTKERIEDFKFIPIMLEYSNSYTQKKILSLAHKLSENIQFVSSDDRKIYHLSGILVNNFTNHLWAMTQELLEKHSLDFDKLKPILKETTDNALLVEKLSVIQTGPAKRGNKSIISEHINTLKEDKSLQKLYALMSELIEEKYKKNK